MLARHEALRMRIGDRDGEPYPEISAAPEDLVTVADLTTLPDANREREGDRLSKRTHAGAIQPRHGAARQGAVRSAFPNRQSHDLEHAPYRRRRMVFVDPAAGTRSGLFRHLDRPATPDLPPLPYQYVDYAAWEAAQVRDGLFERQLGYWKEKLAGVPPLLDLPTDRPRPAQRSFRGNRVDCVIEADVVVRLQQFSKRHDATLFMTVLAAFAVVLHRLTAAGRNRDRHARWRTEAVQSWSRSSGRSSTALSLAPEHRGKSEFCELSVAGPPRDDRSDRQPRSTVRYGRRGDKSRAHARPCADLPSDVRAA